MLNIEKSLVEVCDRKTYLFSYFCSDKYDSQLVGQEIKSKLRATTNTLENRYASLADALKSNRDFRNLIYFQFESILVQTNLKSKSKSRLSTILGVMLDADEDDITLSDAYDYTKSTNIQLETNQFDYLIIQLLYQKPNLIQNLEGGDRIALKKIICRVFDNPKLFSERDQFHQLVKTVNEQMNRNWDYLKREMFKISKLETFVDLKKNRGQIFSFLKNFKSPFIAQFESQNIDLFITNLNSVINQHPEPDTPSYYDYYSKTVVQLKNLIFEFEKTITSFASVTYLPILHLVLNILNNEYNLMTESAQCGVSFTTPDKKFQLNRKESVEIDVPIYYESGNSQARKIQVELHAFQKDVDIEPLNTYCDYLEGRTGHHRAFISKFKIKPILEIENEVELDITISWESIFGKKIQNDGKLILRNIDPKINWKKLRESENPYSLNAKESLDQLIGRDPVVKKLKRGLLGSQSFKIFGQRRVGKTSIAKSLYNFLKVTNDTSFESFIPVFLSMGQIATSNDILGDLSFIIAEELVDNFKLKRGFSPLNHTLNEKEFQNSLTKFVIFVKNLFKSFPDLKIAIFLDEFDELPQQLYQGEDGKNFFLTLKSLTELNSISMIVIGGEKLPIIFSYQGIRFNKINDIAVDYFDTVKNKEDLKELILYPSFDTGIDITDTAIDTIIEYSAGNPYYIMLISSHCFDEVLRREISSVDGVDIERMIKDQLEVISIQHFQHFWEDGKIGTEDEEAWWAYYNSRIMLLSSEMFYTTGIIKLSRLKQAIIDDNIMSEQEFNLHVEQLVRRKVLNKHQENELGVRVKLLDEWLRVKGREEINLLFKNTHYLRDAVASSKKYEYTDENIRHLERKFEGFFKTISKEDIRLFLGQFKAVLGTKEAWYAYKILENIKIYSRTDIERHFKELFKDSIMVDVMELHDLREGTVKRFDGVKNGTTLFKSDKYQNVIVSKIDEEGKSGSEMLRIFAMANNILSKNCLTKNEIKPLIEKNPDQSFIIIFTDDFVGTGDSAVENFERFFKEFPENYFNRHFLYYCVICAYSEGIKRIEQQFGNKFQKIIPYEFLEEKDKAFSDNNDIFSGSHDSAEAKRAFDLIGKKLERKYPLGYKDMRSLVVFWDNAPNDTLPALRKMGKVKLDKEGEQIDWIPLFPRR